MNKAYYESKIGVLEIKETEQGIAAVQFTEEERQQATSDSSILNQCIKQLDQYFAGQRKKFLLPLDIAGTEFQRRVWQQLLTIPYGTTISYGKLAQAVGKKRTAAQAVGGAVGNNKLAIIVPCHRVVGSDGSLTGYRGGIERKKWLLQREQVNG